MRRGAADDDNETAGRLARVVGLPPDPYPWDPGDPPSTSPPSAAGGSWLAAVDPGRRGVRALAAVAALVLCIAAFLAWRSRPQVTPAPPAAAISAAPSVAAVSSAPSRLIVSVNGKVQRPGLVELPAGARVADAIAAAGGALPGADLTGLNLARKVVDGEMIPVGVPAPPGAAGAPGRGSGGGGGGGPVNLNTATIAELQTLPGIGEVLAQRIIEYRDRHGGFRAVTDLRQVEGIGDAKFAQLKDRVTV
ncbi:ComEA family DNA-binding protein [Dactylosporangium sp. NPDC005555]|uniref:ComEA family DNA-binding protein n=1 Tax=Dactylosporangium sp. NPDC005555 TaxID=3154889 RepID=UPI0033A68DFE